MFQIISYRSPYQVEKGTGRVVARRNLGGVVFTLEWLLSRHGGHWISADGYSGCSKGSGEFEIVESSPTNSNYTVKLVTLQKQSATLFYSGCCNRAIWPLFHGAADKCTFDSAEWAQYRRVNKAFASIAKGGINNNEMIWVHDFHFVLVGQYLRNYCHAGPLLFFWHIPFPGLEVVCRFPWIKELLKGFLAYDVIGFHTPRYVNNFIDAAEFLLGLEVDRENTTIKVDGRCVSLSASPVGIDFHKFQMQTISAPAGAMAKKSSGFVFLGVDRRDYTKGIVEKLKAFRSFLHRFPELLGRVHLVQIAAPTRTDIPEYQSLDRKIQHLAETINQEYGTPEWQPVAILDESLDRISLVPRYRSADALIVNSLADGLNLVSLEFIASRNDEEGVLLLSRNVGAAHYLSQGALLINPFDEENIVQQMKRAVEMDRVERMIRMQRLRSAARDLTVQRWLDKMLGAVHGAQYGSSLLAK